MIAQHQEMVYSGCRLVMKWSLVVLLLTFPLALPLASQSFYRETRYRRRDDNGGKASRTPWRHCSFTAFAPLGCFGCSRSRLTLGSEVDGATSSEQEIRTRLAPSRIDEKCNENLTIKYLNPYHPLRPQSLSPSLPVTQGSINEQGFPSSDHIPPEKQVIKLKREQHRLRERFKRQERRNTALLSKRGGSGTDEEVVDEASEVTVVNNSTDGSSSRRRVSRGRHVIKAFHRARSLEELQTLVDEMLALYDNKVYDATSLSARDETDIIRILGSRGAYASMLAVLNSPAFKKGNVYSYTAAIQTLAQSNDSKWRTRAIKLVDEMAPRGVVPNTYTFTAVLLAIDGGKAAMDMLRRMVKEFGVQPDVHVYNGVMHCCSRIPTSSGDEDYGANGSSSSETSNGWQLALTILDRMRKEGITPTESSYASILHCCAKGRQTRVAMALVREMRELGIQPSPRAYGAALNACASTGDYVEALSLFKQLAAEGKSNARLRPNTLHYNSLLSALSKAGQDQQALSILDELCIVVKAEEEQVATGETRGRRSDRFSAAPDIVTLNTVLAACARGRNYKDARRLLDRMGNGEFKAYYSLPRVIRPDTISYNSVLSACFDPEEALSLLREMRESRRKRRNVVAPTTVSYTNALSLCRRAEDLETAKQIFDLSRDDGLSPNVFMYSTYIWTAEKCGDYREALSAFCRMQEEGCRPNAVSFDGVISACASSGKWREVLELYRAMSANEIPPTAITFQKIAYSLRECPPEEKVTILKEVVSTTSVDEIRPRVSFPVIDALLRALSLLGSCKEALEFFALIPSPDEACFCSALSVCGPHGRSEEAKELIGRMRDGGLPVGSAALGHAVMACAKANQWRDALDLLDEVGVKDTSLPVVPVAALNSVISSCGRNGQTDVAVKLLGDMKSKYNVSPNERSYRSAIIACNQAEHEKARLLGSRFNHKGKGEDDDGLTLEWWECALSLLRRMKEDGMRPDIQTYSSAISACEAAGKWQRAVGILKMMEAVQSTQPNFVCINAAISACEKGGAYVEAVELLERMRGRDDISPSFVTINSVLIALDKAGQRELAESIYNEAVEDGIVAPWKEVKAEPSDEQGDEGAIIRMMDLHQFSASMAKIAVRSVIESLLGPDPFHDTSRDLTIIVGKGKRSEGGRPILMPVILDLMTHEFGIAARIDENNRGRLILASEDLADFVNRKGWR